MLRTSLRECQEFLAGDHTLLRELLHPAKADLRLGYSLAHGRLEVGKRSKWHRLASSEVYYFLAGAGVFALDDRSVPVTPGTVVYVPPGVKQSLVNNGPAVIEFLCLVDPAWRAEDEEMLE